MTTKILIAGANGRMGQSILECARQDSGIKVAATLEKGDLVQNRIGPGMVIVDFTTHTATPSMAKIAADRGNPMVIGTTGFTASERNAITRASKKIPIVMAPNMSVGVNLLFSLTQIMSLILKEGYDVEIIDKHHRRKVDSPSGTAARLAEVVAKARGIQIARVAKYGRKGDLGERTTHEIGIHSVRGGDFIGEHTVIFAGEGETVEITHKANSRFIFAKGALLAAKWVAKANPGIYDMFDVLGLDQVWPQPA